MERIIKKDRYGNIACNNILIYTTNGTCLGDNIEGDLNQDWKFIEPKYFRYLDDNTILEIWYNGKGILLSGKLKGFINDLWTTVLREEITYKEAMYFVEQEQNKDLGYNNKNLMSRVITDVATAGFNPYDLEQENKDESLSIKQNNNGGASDWYALPKNANTLQDLIEHRNMNGSVKDIFKACYRLGIKTEDELRDLNKMAYYSLREIGRITNRRDYITIAEELMGEQAIENQQNKN